MNLHSELTVRCAFARVASHADLAVVKCPIGSKPVGPKRKHDAAGRVQLRRSARNCDQTLIAWDLKSEALDHDRSLVCKTVL